jgi:hypothetical protein
MGLFFRCDPYLLASNNVVTLFRKTVAGKASFISSPAYLAAGGNCHLGKSADISYRVLANC